MFHWKDGWFFSRQENGSVLFEHRVYGTEKNELGEAMYTIDIKANIPDTEWASIVASVSARGEISVEGEIGGTWAQALSFHNAL